MVGFICNIRDLPLVGATSVLIKSMNDIKTKFSFESVELTKDPEEEGLYIMTLRKKLSLTEKSEDLENVIAGLDEAFKGIGEVKERGVSEEQLDAWAYVEFPRDKLDTFLRKIGELGHVMGSLEIKGDKVGSLIYPKGSLSGLTIKACYEIVSMLPDTVKSFSIIGYELHGDHLEISLFLSTKEECTPVHVHHHEEVEEE